MKLHEVESVNFEGNTLVLRVDGGTFRVNLDAVSPRLAAASEAARRNCQVSPSGRGLHWPDVDEDLSVDGLIRDSQAAASAAVPTAGVFALHDKPIKQ